MRQQTLVPGPDDRAPMNIKLFSWRSEKTIRREKVTGALIVVGIPVVLNVVLALV